jgi:hypothetical protein
VSGSVGGEEHSVAHASIVALVMVVRDEFVDGVPERALANEDQLIQTRFFEGPDETFRVRIQIGRTGRQADGFDTGR